ncbi:probable carotenoid cleavage dioxygenase 4, chloroplastic [Malania oleifera]|uniref:probable carotenoid cleavage dioxygenase 4, chloroplastic n=1 Tax=Malania oleifera TaxID=397392 RepID=UPI0025AEBB5C|nr:probable carotenoid cleavage dioxygenase 4, chloroplastic [Malania oleifera]
MSSRFPLRSPLPTPRDRSYVQSPTSSHHMKTIFATTSTTQPPTLAVKSSPQQKTKIRANPSLLAAVFNGLDHFINNFIDPPLLPATDPRYVLSGNFAPVDELPPTECEVAEGTLPPCLAGAYIRNGPNPHFLPRGPYHPFDGDGMLHSVRISCGRATFCSRYVKTYKYTIERDVGHPVFPTIFSGFHGVAAATARTVLAVARILAGQFNPRNGIGSANTNVAFLGNRLYALCESDLPYAVRLTPDGDIETLGQHSFGGKLVASMAAHPKTDPDTGETFAFRYSLFSPFLTFFHFDPLGNKRPDVPIFSMHDQSFFHDFAITKNYVVFVNIHLGLRLGKLIRGGSIVGGDPTRIPRLGIIPRYAKDDAEMRWFDVPGFNILHVTNAWEDDGDDCSEAVVVVVAPNVVSMGDEDEVLERLDLMQTRMEKLKLEVETGKVTRYSMSRKNNLELATMNPAYVGKKNRYVYAGVVDRTPRMSGVVKLDVWAAGGEERECTVASREFGSGWYGGEPLFVAREADDPTAAEDDGYLMCYVHNEEENESRLLVMDAKSPRLDVVAAVKLPQRVPYGFHGLFVGESDLRRQNRVR